MQPRCCVSVDSLSGSHAYAHCGIALSEARRREKVDALFPTACAVVCTNIAPPVLSGREVEHCKTQIVNKL